MRFGLVCRAYLFIAVGLAISSAENVRQTILTHETSPLLSLHRKLVEIESTTYHEHDTGVFLVEYLRARNMTVDVQKVPTPEGSPSSNASNILEELSSRFNIHAYHGDDSTTRTLVTSHYDTVPPYWPYYRANDGHELWGRGSVDAKAAVAAQIIAYVELRAEGRIESTDVGLLFVVGEETGGDGMRMINALNLAWDAVIFGEPTEGKLATGHKGLFQFVVRAVGKAAHSGYPWLGQSANSILIPALAALEDLKTKLPSSDKYGETTLNIGMIRGGVAANVIAETAEAQVAVRLAAGTPAEIEKLVRDAVEHATRDIVKEHGSIEVLKTAPGYGPVDLDHDIEGFETITVNYGTDV